MSHLENHPLQRVVTLALVSGQEAPGFLGQIDQDRARLHHAVGRTARTIGVDDGRNLVVGRQLQMLSAELIAGTNVHIDMLPLKAQFLEHDHDFLAIGGRHRIEFNHGRSPSPRAGNVRHGGMARIMPQSPECARGEIGRRKGLEPLSTRVRKSRRESRQIQRTPCPFLGARQR